MVKRRKKGKSTITTTNSEEIDMKMSNMTSKTQNVGEGSKKVDGL